MTTYDDAMVAERITISIDAALAHAVRDAAEEDHVNVSAWASEALQQKLNQRGLRAVIADWEAEHGAFTEQELEQARKDLGW